MQPGIHTRCYASMCSAGQKAFVTVSFYLYGDTAADIVARDRSAWTAWMTNLFPAYTRKSPHLPHGVGLP